MAKEKCERTQTKTRTKTHAKKRKRKAKKRYSALLFLGLFGKASLIALPVFAWLYVNGTLDELTSKTAHLGKKLALKSSAESNQKQVGAYHPNLALKKAEQKKISHDQRVNRLLRMLDNKIEWDTAKIEVENHRYAPGVNMEQAKYDLQKQTKDSIAYGVVEQPEPKYYGVEKAQYDRTLVLDEQINERLWADQVEDVQSDVARKEYVKKFIENARRAGYAVTLDDNYRVRKVRKIRRTY